MNTDETRKIAALISKSIIRPKTADEAWLLHAVFEAIAEIDRQERINKASISKKTLDKLIAKTEQRTQETCFYAICNIRITGQLLFDPHRDFDKIEQIRQAIKSAEIPQERLST